jgi:hypothetical protein
MPMTTPFYKDPNWGNKVDYPLFLNQADFEWLQTVLGPPTSKDVRTAVALCVEDAPTSEEDPESVAE